MEMLPGKLGLTFKVLTADPFAAIRLDDSVFDRQ